MWAYKSSCTIDYLRTSSIDDDFDIDAIDPFTVPIGSSGGDENVSAMPNAQPRAPCLAHKIRIFLGGRLEILRRRAAAAYDINRIKQSINQASNLLLPIIAIQHTYTRSIAALSFSHNTISYHHG